MVATKGKTVDLSDLLGTRTVRPQDVTRHTWNQVIAEHMKTVELKSLRGFQRAEDIAQRFQILSRVPKRVMGTEVQERILAPWTGVYLPCAVLRFTKENVFRRDMPLMPEEHLVLDRSGKFHSLTFWWKYTGWTSNAPDHFSLVKFESKSFASSRIPWEQGFCDDKYLGWQVLDSLRRAQSKTNEEMSRLLAVGTKAEEKITGTLRRLGWNI